MDQPFFRFPGGEWHMKFDPETYVGKEVAVIRGRVELDDLLKLQMWSEIIREQGGSATAIIPYLPAARADRGLPSSGKMYANMINDANLDQLICYDPHSELALEFYADSRATKIVAGVEDMGDFFKSKNYDGIIAPDQGAIDRANELAKALGIKVHVAGKKRDFETGQLSGFETPSDMLMNDEKYLIVDDICDGGGTFNGLYDQMWEDGMSRNTTIDLYVSHGIFSKGTKELAKRFGTIYTTDSMLKSLEDEVEYIPVLDKLFERV